MATIIGSGQCGTDGARGKNQWLYVDSTRATDEEIAAVEPLYKALNADVPVSVFIKAWWCVKAGWVTAFITASLAGAWSDDPDVYLLTAMLWFVAAPVVTYFLCTLWYCWQALVLNGRLSAR